MSPGFPRFWWGEAVSGFGDAITLLALQTLAVITLQGGAVQVGWVNSARWLPYLVLGLVVGALVDRVRRRPVITDLARAVLLTLIPLAWVLNLLTFPLLLIVVIVFGTASLINDAASMSSVPRLVPRAKLQRAHARLLAAALPPSGWAATAVLAAGQFCHGWAMGVSNSHEMSYRQALAPDELQARTNTTMRSLNRAVLVIVSPIAGVVAGWFGFGLALIAGTVVFAVSALILTLSPFRRARVSDV